MWRTVLWRAVLGLCWLVPSMAASAQDDDPSEARYRQHEVFARSSVSLDSVRLPGHERMGLVSVSHVLQVADDWWVGPTVNGAVTGQRGGLIVWGAELQRTWILGSRVFAVTGLEVGGGGGADAPVGGGLMVRPHGDLMVKMGDWHAGVSASWLKFPNGHISSSQIGLQVSHVGTFSFVSPQFASQRQSFRGSGGLGVDSIAPALVHYRYRVDGQTHSLSLVGVRLQHHLGPAWQADLEGMGAASGGADGFAELLAGLSLQGPGMTDHLVLGARAAVGVAGGGAVPTGGGLVAKAGVNARLILSPTTSLQLEGGLERASHGSLRAHYGQVSLGLQFGDGSAHGGQGPGATEVELHDMEWGLGSQHYGHASRKAGPAHDMNTIGLRLQRSLGHHAYLTGQTYSAISGGAGAYSIGLIGAGLSTHSDRSHPSSVGAEALIGAAGGGGVATKGGAVVQGLAWVGHDLDTHNRLKLGVGWLKSARGSLSTPVVEVSWVARFGTP